MNQINPLRPLKAVLKEIKPENFEVKTYTLQVSDGFPSTLTPGQFNMLGYPGIGEAPISFSSLWESGEIQHTIRGAGMATRFVEKMEQGSEVLLRGPYGRGWPMEAARGKDLLLVAGGLGIAPLRPVINEIVKNRSDYGEVFLLYGLRNEKSLIFADEYKKWRKGINFQITVDELVTKKPWAHGVGLITTLLDKLEINSEKTRAFVCGPELMMRFISRGLTLRGLASTDIYVSLERRMKCGIAQCGHCQHVGLFVCKDGPVFSYAEVAGLFDGLL